MNVWLIRLVVLILFLLPVLGWGIYALIWLITPWRDNSIPLERMLTSNSGPKN